MKAFKEFLLEAIKTSKAINELMFYFKMKVAKDDRTFSSTEDLDSFYQESLIYAIKQVYPKLYHISDEGNENLLGHLLITTKERNIVIENPKDYVTKHRLYSPDKYSYSLKFSRENNIVPTIRFQTGTYSVDPKFQDDHIVYTVFEEIKDFFVEVLSYLSRRPDQIKVAHNQEHSKLMAIPDLFKISAVMSYKLSIDGVDYFLFHIPQSVEEADLTLKIQRVDYTSLPEYLPNCNNVFITDTKIKNLKGSPAFVKKNFICERNELVSLSGAPKEVGLEFSCRNSNIRSLSGCSKMKVGDNFVINNNNNLVSLSGSPKEIGYSFICNQHPLLRNLKGGPKKVGKSYLCEENSLVSLEGSPKEIPGEFNCAGNSLRDLLGGPEKVGGDFNCSSNKITSLEGCPKEVGGDFICLYNERDFSEEEIRKVCHVKGSVIS